MTIKAIAPWYGSKRLLAPEIIKELGPHKGYLEPFCGSMSVLLAKRSCSLEIVNDRHHDLTNLARVIKSETDGPNLYRKLRRTTFCDELYGESVAMLQDEFREGVERAYHYFVASWMGRNGNAGIEKPSESLSVRYGPAGGSPTVRFAHAAESIKELRKRLRNVLILNKDAFDVIGRFEDHPESVLYVDPPYVQKSSRYKHEIDREGHARLAEALDRFEKARVVVSYYDDPLLRDLYASWTWRRVEVPKFLGNTSGGASKAEELLLINGPSLVETEQRELF